MQAPPSHQNLSSHSNLVDKIADALDGEDMEEDDSHEKDLSGEDEDEGMSEDEPS